MTEQERLAVELLEAIEAARGSKGYCSARKIERWVRERLAFGKKKCQRCREWLALAEYRRATGYALGVASECRVCERQRVMCPEGCDPGTAAATPAP